LIRNIDFLNYNNLCYIQKLFHKKHLDWIKEVNPHCLVSVKLSTPTDVDMVAVGSYYAGAHIIHMDGSYGGTGAAPDIAKKNIAYGISGKETIVGTWYVI